MADWYKWGVVQVLPDGHRLFPEHEGDRIAIADKSGREPQDTDDGVLYLDFDRDLSIENNNGRASFYIPLKKEGEKHPRNQTHTVTDVSTLMELAAQFEWPVDEEGTTYSIEKVGE